MVTTIIVTVYVGPSESSLHFWWYPMIVIGMYSALFIGVALEAKVPEHDLITMTLLGICEGSFVAYTMQIWPLVWLILTIAAFEFYLYRGF